MEIKLSHIAVACPEIAKVAKKLETLGLKESERHEVPTEKVIASMIPAAVSSHFRIELLEATANDSPIAKFLEKRPHGGLHHVSFEVTKIEEWQKKLAAAGIEILPPGIRTAARGKALFIHPKSMGGVLVELEEISGA